MEEPVMIIPAHSSGTYPRKRNMSSFTISPSNLLLSPLSSSPFPHFQTNFKPRRSTLRHPLLRSERRDRTQIRRASSKSSSEEEEAPSSSNGDEWLKRLPEKKKPLYSHSLPCIEAWLRQLGFYQSREDRAVWLVEKPNWHAHLSLDLTDLCIRYVKSGPGNLEKDVERRFSYALSREDIENAVLGGP